MVNIDPETWQKKRIYSPEQLETARLVLEELRRGRNLEQAMRRHPQPEGGYPAKHILVAVYRSLVERGEWQPDTELLERIRMKPVRTLSGVTTVTVLTKPYPCPGKCIFCPTDARMPKSYLPDEPGARRGLQHHFDPYDQVRARLEALEAVGHPTDKIELLILGGTWSAYRRDYQEWFVRRCFDALNTPNSADDDECSQISSGSLIEAQQHNETASHRNVGLVIETRPDRITPRELAWLRRLGVTKVQMGAQSLDDHILELNQRGHTAGQTLRATALLRAAGFKIVLHWMPNLLGATLYSDREDFGRLWAPAREGLGYNPDEIKIYPCELLPNADLIHHWERGEYHPYTQDELVNLIADIKPGIPPYCRVNRVIRDIPSTNVVAGNKRTSLRQDVHAELKRRGQHCNCIRCREVGNGPVDPAELRLRDTVYSPAFAEEHFLSYENASGRVVGYLRLSLPLEPPASLGGKPFPRLDAAQGFADLENAALIREVHVYGQSLPVGVEQPGAAQHIGLGTSLLQEAEAIARQKGFSRIAVIAAIGTRPYYQARGFESGDLYLIKELSGFSAPTPSRQTG